MCDQIFEQILEERIGFGKHQKCQFLIVSLIDFLNGAEFLYLSLLIPTLHKEWNLSVLEIGVLGSTFNFGLMIGTTVYGVLADYMGRKNTLILGTFLQTFLILFTALSTNITQMIVLRLTFGIVHGVILPLSSIMMIEVTPKQFRGQVQVALQIAIFLGKVWMMGLGYIFMFSISQGNWRAIALCNSLPSLFCFIGAYILVQESPRFLLIKGEFQEGLDILNKIGNCNVKNFIAINDQEVKKLKEWQLEQKTQHLLQSHSVFQLFNKENLSITWKNFTLFFIFMFVIFAVFLIVPFILENENKTLSHVFLIEFADIPAIIFMIYTIDYFGRLSTLIFSTTISTIILAAIWFWEITIIVVGLFIFKIFCKINYGTLHVLFPESYHTFYRSLGVGVTLSVGRTAAAIVPFIIYPIYFYSHYMPFLLCSCLSFITGILLIFYPIDLTKKPLDQLESHSDG